MTPIGEVKFYFSEPLRSINEFKDLNLTSISNDYVFNVLYQTYANEDQEI